MGFNSNIQPSHPLLQLALETAKHLSRVNVRRKDQIIRDKFVSDIETVMNLSAHDGVKPAAPVRALRHAPVAFSAVPTFVSENLLQAARSALGHVHWTEFYEPAAWSKPFLADFANGEGIGPDGTVRCDTMILGLFILGPNTLYPPHAHPAEEFYLTLSGAPDFQVGDDAPFVTIAPGEVAWHGSDVSHAIRTGPDPFLAVFGWRGSIHERSWYRSDMSDAQSRKRYPKISKG